MARTRKPCPACKEVDPGRAAADVCYECKSILGGYAELIAALKKQLKRKELVAVSIHDRSYDQPYIARNDDRIQKAFFALCEASTMKSWRKGSYYNIDLIETEETEVLFKKQRQEKHNQRNQVLASRETFDALNELYNAIMDLSDAQYLEGFNTGRDLLMGLHEGSLTMTEFEDRSDRTNERYSETNEV